MGAAARRGRPTDTEAVLFSVSVFNFQLSILSFQFYPRRLPLPSALGPRPSSLFPNRTHLTEGIFLVVGDRAPSVGTPKL